MNYGWKGTIQDFLQLSLNGFIANLTTYVYGSDQPYEWVEEKTKVISQQRAWKDCFEKLQIIFRSYSQIDGWLIFEYSILRGSGRRPDVLLLLPGHVLVIECKSYNTVNAAEYLQTSLYIRDIEHYHSTVQQHSLKVTGVLLLTNHTSEALIPKNEFQVYLASQNSLHKLINGLIKRSTSNTITANQFLAGTYHPSPSMLEAAHAILNNEDLPRIKAVDSSNFDDVYNTIQSVIDEAQKTNTHHLILVSGEPGAGKTFLGLKIAHATPNSAYLSGNGPLVEVLQDTLNNKTFVQSLYGYKRDYLQHAKKQIQSLYNGDHKTYGILCASGADRSKNVPVVPFGDRHVLPKPATAYFNYHNSEYYCKKLRYAATEFQTQGLELDTAIVHWDEDLYWDNGQWQCKHTKSGAKNPRQMKINAYRVLLTRGRDATIIYIPDKPILKDTWDLFIHGLKIPVL